MNHIVVTATATEEDAKTATTIETEIETERETEKENGTENEIETETEKETEKGIEKGAENDEIASRALGQLAESPLALLTREIFVTS